MIAEPAALSDADLDALFADATAAEVAGRLEDALASLAIAVAELIDRKLVLQYPFEWLARLQSELGDMASAERSLLAGRAIAAQAGHRPGVLRMDVARSRLACAAADLSRSATLLAELADDRGPLGPPLTERFAELAAWLDALRFPEQPDRNLAVLQAEAALAVAELWAEQGKYRSALRLVDRFTVRIAAAGPAIRADHVELLYVEWLLAAGELADAEPRLARLTFTGAVDATRIALVRARAALLAGRLDQAIAELDRLDRVPVTEPRLFASATALRVALQCELNLLDAAEATAQAAIAKLEADPGAERSRALIDRARCNAVLRRRSAIALWEQPVLVGGVGSSAGDPARVVLDLAAEAGAGFTAAWTTAANRVLIALEAGDVTRALVEHAGLERATQGAESRYIAARVRLSAALIEHHRAPGDSTVDELIDVARELHAIGARQDEAQALRFAAWTSARLGRIGDYAALARRAADAVDAIADRLEPATRTLYLMNKWSGRDEFVAGAMKRLLVDDAGQPRQPRARETLRTFRKVEALTSWPIDEAFGDEQAARLAGNATSDMVMQWVAERLSPAGARRQATGLTLRHPLALWWFPGRTLVLQYHVLADRSYLFRIARRHIDVVLLPVGRVHLRLDMRAALADPAQLTWLAEKLGITDAVERFPCVRRLVVIPHDAIANVPFAALPVRDGVLCQRVAIAQLDRLSRLRRKPRAGRLGRLVAVGLSDYAGSGYADLPQTEVEARSVAAALRAVDPYLHIGRAATCGDVLAALPQATHLHVAAHGSFDHAHPADSGVLLRDRAGHRTLTLHELRRTDLRRMQLATLATCRSAEGAQLPGRERICLPTALLDAGARGVIASLWPIEDEPSVRIMRGLYERLRSEPPATALARMQAGLRTTEASHHWAGLVFYGNE